MYWKLECIQKLAFWCKNGNVRTTPTSGNVLHLSMPKLEFKYIKCVLVGDGCAGKTAFIETVTTNVFPVSCYSCWFEERLHHVTLRNGQIVSVKFWHTRKFVSVVVICMSFRHGSVSERFIQGACLLPIITGAIIRHFERISYNSD